jgi:hypothetical protein
MGEAVTKKAEVLVTGKGMYPEPSELSMRRVIS